MNCALCRGACCESLTVGLDTTALAADERRWVELHAVGIEGPAVTFAARCTMLTAAGRCAIYDERPDICQDFAVGGAGCLATVRLRRTPAEYQHIREEGDPVSLIGAERSTSVGL